MSRRSGNGCLTRRVGVVAAVLGLWGALVLLFAAPLALTGRVAWVEAVSLAASLWALWLLFLPGVAWLSFRFPIERGRLLRNIGIHVLACVLVAGINRATVRRVAGVFPTIPTAEAPGWLPESGTGGLARQAPGPRLAPPAPPPRRALDLVGPPQALGVFLGLRAALDVLVYGSVVGVCVAIRSSRGAQERERRAVELEGRLARARLQALSMQINPHFLFNTLNSITTLVYVDPRAADEMLGDLSELLRRSLDSMEQQEVSLAEELGFLEGYVRIEQKRLGERLRVERSIPEDLMMALVPTLVLQPLVENAIRHGIEPRRGPGRISIEARREDRHLHLIVRDDGRGMVGPDGDGSERCGIGLSNTRARLRALYGTDQSFAVGNTEPQGCRVDIRLPLHLRPVTLPVTSKDAVV